MSDKKTILEYVTNFFSLVPLVLYTIVAMMLTIIAIVSVYDSVILIFQLITSSATTANIVSVINSLLLTITIIVLFETVTVYFKTKHVEVRALLVAGLTGMVRHILIYNMEKADPFMIGASVALLAVLIAGIVLIKPEPVP
ncbi:MAG: phosphate-starvation-inducible PsiE family protein [Methanomicrobiales archaeon]|nr:phosphate-starvation-inducible PsiE family protein [Methanomicrobiales archaeon]